MAPQLPGRHCVHLKQCGRLLLCSVYVPSSHSWHCPKRPAAVQGDVKRVPEAERDERRLEPKHQREELPVQATLTSRAVQAADVAVQILQVVSAAEVLLRRADTRQRRRRRGFEKPDQEVKYLDRKVAISINTCNKNFCNCRETVSHTCLTSAQTGQYLLQLANI